MQGDRGLVQHIEHASQAGPDLGSEADALAFAARQGAGGARQGEVFQADIVEEFQPLADLLQDAEGDFLRSACSAVLSISTEPAIGVADRLVADFSDVQAADLHRQRLGLQAIAAADIARRLPPGTSPVLRASSRCRFHDSAGPYW